MLKVWNACLIVATFSLALLGTFLVRSGVLQSIHAFGDSTVGPYILGLIAVVLIGSTALIVSRLDDLRSEKRIDSLASRESVFLVNNLLLVALCAIDLLGHLLPADLRAVHRRARPRWRRPGSTATRRRWRSSSSSSPGSGRCSPGGGSAGRRRSGSSCGRRWPAWSAAVRRSLALHRRRQQALGACPLRLRRLRPGRPRAGVLARAPPPAGRSRAARSRAPWSRVAARNRRRYGGYIVHVGIAVLLIGIAASSSFQTNRDVNLRPGQSAVIDGYKVTYVRHRRHRRPPRLHRGGGSSRREGRQGLHPASDPPLLPPDRGRGADDLHYFGGESDSDIGLRARRAARLLDRGPARP